jgi:hypothetical protein
MTSSNRLFLVLIAAFLLLAAIDIHTGETGLTTDGACYLRLAENLFGGRGYTLHGEHHTVFPPGYPLLVGLLSFMLGNHLLAGQVISIASTIGAAYVLMTILRRWKTASLIQLGFVAVFLFNWAVMRLSVLVLSDSLYLFLMLLNLRFMLEIFESRPKISFPIVGGLGFVNGYMYLVRTEGILISAVNLIFLMTVAYRRRSMKVSKVLLYVFCFLLLSLPYVVYLHHASGHWTLAGKSMNLTICEKISSDDPLVWEKNGYKLLEDGRNVMITSAATSNFNVKEYILSNKDKLAKRAIKNAVSYLKVAIYAFGLTILLLLYIPKSAREMKTIYLLLLLLSSLYLLIFSIGRYWISYLPVFLLLIFDGAKRFEERYGNRAILYILIWSALIVNLYAGKEEYVGIFKKKEAYAIEKNAATWLDNNVDERAQIVLRKPEVAYLGHRQWIRIPWFEHRDEFIDYMRRNGFEYFILGDNERATRPFLREDEANGTILEYAKVVEQIDYGDSNLKIMKLRDDYR